MAAPDLLSRLDEVERRRRLEAVSGMLSAIAIGQLFFAAFAFGHARGPLSLRAVEVLAGMSGALVLSLIVARLLRRRRLERRADGVLRLREGRRVRRVALFADHFTIDEEVVLVDSVQTAELSSGRLLLRYVDPRHSGPVLRELEASSSDLHQLQQLAGGRKR